MSSGYPIDPKLAAALEGAMTISASPGMVEDHTRPDIGPVAMLTMPPSISVYTSDDHVGAEVVDMVAPSLLRWGFALVTAIEPAELVALPLLPDWDVILDATGHWRSTSPAGCSTTVTSARARHRAGNRRCAAVAASSCWSAARSRSTWATGTASSPPRAVPARSSAPSCR